MDWIRELLSRCASLWNKRQHDRELEDELQAHVELAVAEKVRQGMPEPQARTAALRDFGGMTQTKEAYRAQRGLLFPAALWQDVHYSLRRLRQSPGFASIVVLTLALGIGANTAIFTLVQSILMRSLPVADPSRLYRIGDRMHCCYFAGFESDDGDFDLFSYDLFRRFRDAAPEFEQLAAVQAGGGGFTVRWGDTPAKAMRAEYVSGNYFTTLGINTYAGRLLSQNDDAPGAAPVLVLSYAAWQSEFGGNPGIIGSVLHLERHAFTVIGIAPPDFYGDRIAPFPPDFWIPLGSEPAMEGANSSVLQPETAWLYAIGRLRPDVNRGSLQTKLSTVLRQWMMTRPAFTEHGGAAEIPKQHVILSAAGGGIQKVQEQTGTGLRMLMLLSSVVLLIACANIANLLLARSMAQRAEIAVRIGLGATRTRIIRQILTESLILSTMGGTAGLALAFFGSRAILGLAFPLSRNMPVSASPSWVVLAFAFAVSLLTGILFAAAPAWILSGAQPAEASRSNNSSSRDHASIPQRLLLVFQLALSIVLVASAFVATRSLYKLEHQQIGFETAHRYAVQLDMSGAGFTSDRLPTIYRNIEDQLLAIPGATRVSFARYLPLEGNEWGSCVILQGHPAPRPKDPCFSDWNRVGVQFLNAIGVPIVRGRGFTNDDSSGSAQVVLVNQTFAKHFFPDKDPLGQRFGVNGTQYSSAFQIVGVFADFKLSDAREEVKPLFLRPMSQRYTGYQKPEEQAAETNSLYLNRLILEFSRPPQNLDQMIRTTLAKVDPNIPVIRVLPYPDVVAGNFNQDRLLARLTEAFGGLALLLASVGLYGVMSYLAARRTNEIGIRIALGANRSKIMSMMVRSAILQLGVGLAIGIPASLAAGRAMTKLLYEVHGGDPWSLAGAIVVLSACAAIATILPAGRAASVDPMQALRRE